MPTAVCQHCKRPITLIDDHWIDSEGRSTDLPEDREPRLDVFDVPDPMFGGLSYREATFARFDPILSSHLMPYAHAPLSTWWYAAWGPEPQYILDNRALVERVLASQAA